MNWGNHQPKTGLIEEAFAKSLRNYLKANQGWCYFAHDQPHAIPVTLRHSDGRVLYFQSGYAAAKWIGITPHSLYQSKTAKGWLIEK